MWRPTRTDVKEPAFSPVVLKSWPIRSRCEYGDVRRRVGKRECTQSRRIQNFEKRISEHDFTVWNVQKPFEKIPGSELKSSIGNSMQTEIVGSSISKTLPICIELPIQNSSSASRNLLNNVCTFHAVKSCSENRSSNFWILRDRVHSLFPTRQTTSPYSQRLRIDQLFKMIGEIY